MSFNFIWLFVMLFALMALGMPIAFALLVSSFAYISIFKLGFTTAVVQCIQAPMSQTLLSMGFFILAGNLMNNGGVTRRIFRFCQDLVGWIPGGLGHANVVASVIFAGMSGTALGDAGGLGAIEVKAMKDEGFDLDFSLAVTGASSVLGPIIPPSVPMVMLAVITGVSTGRLFFSGVIPGLIAAGGMMFLIWVISVKRHYPRAPFPKGRVLWDSFRQAFFPLMTPVIILASIYTGVVTPSEAAVLAAVYAMIIGIASKDLDIRKIPQIFMESARLLVSVLFIVVATKAFGYIIAVEQVPAYISRAIMANVSSPVIGLLLIQVILVICGCILDNNATILIVTPVLFPVATALGIDPVHFCLVFTFTLMIGVVTPPVGIVLYVLQGMSGIPFGQLCKAMLPFIILLFACAILMALCPALSTWLPSLIFG